MGWRSISCVESRSRKKALQQSSFEWVGLIEVAIVKAVLKWGHRSDAAEVTNMHGAGAGEAGDVV